MYINIEKKPVFNRSIYKGETAEPGKYRRRQGTGKTNGGNNRFLNSRIKEEYILGKK